MEDLGAGAQGACGCCVLALLAVTVALITKLTRGVQEELGRTSETLSITAAALTSRWAIYCKVV